MKYRCLGCGMNCTVSVPKNTEPTICPVSAENTAVWKPATNTPRGADKRMNPAQVERMRDARIKPVVATDERGERTRYKSITEAANALGVNTGGIARALKNPGYRAGGYSWAYVGRTQDETRLFIAAQNGLEEYLSVLKETDPERYNDIMEE